MYPLWEIKWVPRRGFSLGGKVLSCPQTSGNQARGPNVIPSGEWVHVVYGYSVCVCVHEGW